MLSASEITDALQLLTTTGTCSCSTVPASQTEMLRRRRACIASSQRGDYVIDTVTVVNGGGGNYKVGHYLEIPYGSPNLLVMVTHVTTPVRPSTSVSVIDVAIVNQPILTTEPLTTAYGSYYTPGRSGGTGATFLVTVKRNPAVCCTCSL